MSQIDEIFNCKFCKKCLDEPVLLPCGESICQLHTFELVKNICKSCGKKHHQPVDGFPINKALKGIIDSRKMSIYKFEEMSVKDLSDIQDKITTLKNEKYNDCKQSIDELKAYINEIDSNEIDSKTLIQNYFAEISRKVLIRKESLKSRIETYYEEINDQIYLKLQEEIKGIDNKSGFIYRVSLEDIKNIFSDTVSDFLQFDKEKIDVDVMKEKIQDIRLRCDKLLQLSEMHILKNKKYKFDYEENASLDSLLGKFECVLPKNPLDVAIEKSKLNKIKDEPVTPSKENKSGSQININATEFIPKKIISNSQYSNQSFIDSTILNSENRDELINVCKPIIDQKWKLIYRASRDGFSSHQFHSKCENFPNSLTIIKTTNGSIFGGYTGKAWNTNYNWISDTESFIFSLIRPNSTFKSSIKIKCIDPQHAIYNCDSFGPVFGYNQGRGFDLCIKSNSNIDFESHSVLGTSYKLWLTQDNGSDFLAGMKRFQTVDIEAYTF